MTNKTQGNLDLGRISRELENEGVELSNNKVTKVVSALRAFLFKVLKQAANSQTADHTQLIEATATLLSERCALKQNIIAAFTEALTSEIASLQTD